MELKHINPCKTGYQIRSMRIDKCYKTQSDLASALGIANETISLWETGTRLPSADNLVGLAKLFECSIEDLIVVKDR